MPTNMANASSWKGRSGTSANIPKLTASVTPAAVMARVVCGTATMIAFRNGNLRAACQM